MPATLASAAYAGRTVTGRSFGTGDGARLVFQLAGMDSEVAYLAPAIYVGGVLQTIATNYTLPQVTNLCLQSNAFTTSPWTLGNTPDPVRTQTDPFGVTNSAWLLTDNNAAAFEFIQQNVTLTAVAYTFSLYVKKTAGATTFPVLVVSGAGSRGENWTIDTNGGILTAWTAITGITTVLTGTSTITDTGTGFWRCSFTATYAVGGFSFIFYPAGTAVSNQSTGALDNTQQGTAVIYGAQLELSSTMGAYVATTTAAASSVGGTVSFVVAPGAGVDVAFKFPWYGSNSLITFGKGDGSTINFSLPMNISTPSIYVNAVLQTLTTNYTLTPGGVVTFGIAPGAALPLTWTGTMGPMP